jgi:hypothetical protein
VFGCTSPALSENREVANKTEGLQYHLLDSHGDCYPSFLSNPCLNFGFIFLVFYFFLYILEWFIFIELTVTAEAMVMTEEE